jgi:hypothetical protein
LRAWGLSGGSRGRGVRVDPFVDSVGLYCVLDEELWAFLASSFLSSGGIYRAKFVWLLTRPTFSEFLSTSSINLFPTERSTP